MQKTTQKPQTVTQKPPLPADIAAEAALLGSVILCPQYCNLILKDLTVEDFTEYNFRDIYEAIKAVNVARNTETEKGLDCVLIRNWLTTNGRMDDKTAADWLVKITDSVPSGENWEYYLKIVKGKTLDRQVVVETEKMSQIAYDGSISPADKKALIEEATFRIKTQKSEQPQEIAEILLRLFDECGKHDKGLMTGFRELDFITDGFCGGQLIVVAGRPSMGKSSMALDFLINLCREGKKVLLFSLEMSEIQIVDRLICSIGKIDSHRFKRYEFLSDEEKTKIHDGQTEIYSKFKLWLDESTVLTPSALATTSRLMKIEHDIDIIIIDYLQLLYSGNKTESRQQEITKICAEVKNLAKSLNIPIVLLSQLNRSCEMRTDKRPQLSDLRESGSIEQDADIVLLLHRPDYYVKRENVKAEDRGKTELIVAKNRQGQTGIVDLVWFGEWFSFKNPAR
jgi:replicative DNA helicase